MTKPYFYLFILLLISPVSWAVSSVSMTYLAEAEPPPCNFVSTPPTIDYGVIARRSLNAHELTQLEVKSFAGGIVIQCEGKTSIGLKAQDNTEGSRINYGTLTHDGHVITLDQADRRFGLGTAGNGNAIGVWGVLFHDARVDGEGKNIGVVGGKVVLDDTEPFLRNDGKSLSWVNGKDIALGETFSVQVDALVGIAKLDDLPSGTEVPFMGSVTIEIEYL